MSRSPYLCECRQLTYLQVKDAIGDGADLARLQIELGCASQCGSCLPEVMALLGQRPPPWRRWLAPGVAAALVAGLLLLQPMERALALGPANTGHADLTCAECHREADGSTRQQVQANVRQWLGLRQYPVDFGKQPIDNAVCDECHDRAGEDRHEPFRFREPRFAEARAAISPQNCVSCHMEHAGGRVTRAGDYCTHCHQEFDIDQDVITPGHQTLADDDRFETCLRCHDFHGNHDYEVPAELAQAFSVEAIQIYLDGGPSPYGEDKHHPDLQEAAR